MKMFWGPSGNQDGVAHNSTDLDETLEEGNPRHMNESGADEFSKGIGSVSLTECLNKVGVQPNTSIPATRVRGGDSLGDPPYTNPGQTPLTVIAQTLVKHMVSSEAELILVSMCRLLFISSTVHASD